LFPFSYLIEQIIYRNICVFWSLILSHIFVNRTSIWNNSITQPTTVPWHFNSLTFFCLQYFSSAYFYARSHFSWICLFPVTYSQSLLIPINFNPVQFYSHSLVLAVTFNPCTCYSLSLLFPVTLIPCPFYPSSLVVISTLVSDILFLSLLFLVTFNPGHFYSQPHLFPITFFLSQFYSK
jgi:hypothetical protein